MAEFSTGILEFRANIDQISADIRRLIGLLAELDTKATKVTQQGQAPPLPSLGDLPFDQDIKIDFSKADIQLAGMQELRNKLNVSLQRDLTNEQKRLNIALGVARQPKKDATVRAAAIEGVGKRTDALIKFTKDAKSLKDVNATVTKLTTSMNQLGSAIAALKVAKGAESDISALEASQKKLAATLQQLNTQQQKEQARIQRAREHIAEERAEKQRRIAEEKRLAAERRRVQIQEQRKREKEALALQKAQERRERKEREAHNREMARLERQRTRDEQRERRRRERERMAGFEAYSRHLTNIDKANKKAAASQADAIGGANFNKKLDAAIERMIIYRAAFTALHHTVLQLQDTIEVFKQIDYRLAQIGKVLPSVGTNFEQIRVSAFRMGKEYGVAINDILDSMKTWAQLGLTQNQTLIATEAALLAVNTTGLSAVEVTNALTAAIFAYNVAVEDAVEVIDKFMAVQANFAVTSQDIAKAMFATGSAAAEMGVSLDQLSGLVVGIGTTTRQTGKEIGNALKTIFARIARPDTIKAFEDIGVAVFKSRGQFRSFFDVLGDAAEKWLELDDAQKQHIGQQAAGVRRYVQFIALMNNFALAQKAAITAQNSLGAATRANQLELQTFQKTLEVMTVMFDEIKYQIGQNLVKPLSVLIDLFRAFTQGPTGKAFVTLATILTGLGVSFIFLRGATLAYGLVMRKLGFETLPQAIKAFIGVGGAVQATGTAATVATSKMAILGGFLTKMLTSLNFWLFAVSAAIGLFAAFGSDVKKFGEGLKFQEKSQREYIKALVQTVKLHEGELKILRDLVASRRTIVEQLDDSVEGTKKYTEAKDKLEKKDQEIIRTDSRLRAVVKDLNTAQESSIEIQERLEEKLSDVEDVKQKAITSNRKLLEAEFIKFSAQHETNLTRYRNAVEDVEKSILAVSNAGGSKGISLVDPAQFRDVETMTDFVDALRATFGEIETEAGEGLGKMGANMKLTRGTVVDVSKQAIDVLKELIDTERGVVEVLSDDASKKAVEDYFDGMTETAEGAQKRISELITEKMFQGDVDKDSGARTASLVFKDLLTDLANDIHNLPSVVQQVLTLRQGDLDRYNELADIMFNLFKPEDDSEYFTKAFIDGSKVAQKYANKLIDIRQYLNEGKSRLEAFFAIGVRGGEQVETMASQLAGYYSESFKRIQKEIFTTEDEIVKLASVAENLRNKDVSIIAADKEKLAAHQKEVTLAEKEETAAKNYLSTLRVMLVEEEYRLTLARKLNDQQKEIANNMFVQSTNIKDFREKTKSLVSDMKDLGFTEREIISSQQERLAGEAQLIKIQAGFVDTVEREMFIRTQARKLTEQQLKLLREMESVDTAKSIQLLSDGAQAFVDSLKEGLSSVPDVLEEGFEKRKELTFELKQAELELQAARRDGDNAAAQQAQNNIDELKKELDDYKRVWYEIKTVVESIVGGISNAAFESVADQFAESIANLQIGGDTIGQEMGKHISAQFDISVQNLIDKNKQLDIAFLDEIERIYGLFLIGLSDALDVHSPSLDAFRYRALPNENADIGESIDDEGKKTASRFDKAMRLGGIYAANVISRAIGQSGGRLGQDLAGIIQIAGTIAFPSIAGGPYAPLIGLGAGILGGLLGDWFGGDKKEEPKITESLERNTDAIEANTLAIKEFNKGIFNAPPRFTLAPFTGNVTTGGAAQIGSISVNVNVPNSPNLNPEDIANEVINVLEDTYSRDIARTRVRATNFV